MRQGANIWWYFFVAYFHFAKNQYYNVKVWWHDVIRCFKSEYFWQDSFRTHYKRLFGCKHKHVSDILDNSINKDFCFDCYREVKK
jgi:hypothetical protein